MQNIVRTLSGLISPINGIEFHEFGELSVSSPIADAELVDQFLAAGGYRLATDDDELPEAVRPVQVKTDKPETAAQRKAREKAEKEAAEATAKAEAEAAAKAKAEADAAAAEAAAKAVAEQEGADKATSESAGESNGDDSSEVF